MKYMIENAIREAKQHIEDIDTHLFKLKRIVEYLETVLEEDAKGEDNG